MKILGLILVLASFTFGQTNSKACQTNYIEIKNIVTAMGWIVTADVGKKHNGGSKHYSGKAVDVSVRGRTEFHIAVLDEVLKNLGYYLFDERVRPKHQKIWTGPHLHIQVPNCK